MLLLILTQGYFSQVSSSKKFCQIYKGCKICCVGNFLFSIDTTVSKHAEIPPCFSAKTRLLSTRIASLWQLLSRFSLRLCCIIVLHGTLTHTVLPSGARTGLQLVLQQMLHNIPYSQQSSSDITSHGKSLAQDGSIPVLRCFEAPGFLPAVGGGLFSPVEVYSYSTKIKRQSRLASSFHPFERYHEARMILHNNTETRTRVVPPHPQTCCTTTRPVVETRMHVVPPHPQICQWILINCKQKAKCRVCMHTESQIEKALYKWQPERRQELLFDTDKPLIALYIALGCLDG